MEGIHFNQIKGLVECNNIYDVNTGVFAESGNTAQWNNNSMYNYAYGYVLDGHMPGGTTNQWTPGTAAWTGLQYDTYVLGGISSGSLLWVIPSTTYSPVNNSGNPYYFPNLYGFGTPAITNGLVAYSGPGIICATPPAGTVSTYARTSYAMAAQKAYSFTENAALKDWIMQLDAWQAMSADSTLNSSDTLHSFRTMCAHSRYKYLGDVESHITAGNFATARTMLTSPVDAIINTDSSTVTGVKIADAPEANDVVNNYKSYYDLVMKYEDTTLSGDDSAAIVALAYKCPFTDGMIVLQARALYSLVFNDVRQFSDLGCHESGEGARKSGSGGSTKTTAAGVAANSIASGVTDGQQYSLYPNPSDGNISLHQYAPDNGPVMAEIMNATGQKVYNGQLHFSEGVAKLSMGNVAPGLYLVKLIDSKQRTFMLKFVIK